MATAGSQLADTEGGSSYLASVSDLMIGLLFIFIIMLMAFAFNYRNAQEASTNRENNLKAQNEQLNIERTKLEERNSILSSIQKTISEREKIRGAMLERIRDELQRSGIQVIVDPEQGVIRLPEAWRLFNSGEAEMREEGKSSVEALASVLDRVLPCYAKGIEVEHTACPDNVQPVLEAIYVEGHTDNVPIRKARFRDNWALSTARATETFRFITEKQPDLSKLQNPSGIALLGVSGYGQERPVASNDTEDGRSINRRIDLRFLLQAPTTEQIEELRRQVDDGTRRLRSPP